MNPKPRKGLYFWLFLNSNQITGLQIINLGLLFMFIGAIFDSTYAIVFGKFNAETTVLNTILPNLSYNKLGGVIPAYRNLSNLVQLYLHNNKYTGLSEFVNLPNLRYFYCHNQFTDGAPSCPRLTPLEGNVSPSLQ